MPLITNSEPTGSIKEYACYLDPVDLTGVPQGYLHCDGSVYDISQYPALYAVIGTTWNNLRYSDYHKATGTTSTTTAITTSSAPVYYTSKTDPSGLLSTYQFTCKYAGNYTVTYGASYSSASVVTSLYKNVSSVTSVTSGAANISQTVALAVNDTVYVTVRTTTGTSNLLGASFSVTLQDTTLLATQFRVPDLRGKCAIGSGQDTARSLTARSLGTYLGYQTHTLSIAELAGHTHSAGTMATETQSHKHTATSSNVDLDHTHSYLRNYAAGCVDGPSNRPRYADAYWRNFDYGPSVTMAHAHTSGMNPSSGNHTHTFTTNTGDSIVGSSHNNMQPYLGVIYVIKY